MAASDRSVEVSKLCIARDYYLPPLPALRCGIYATLRQAGHRIAKPIDPARRGRSFFG